MPLTANETWALARGLDRLWKLASLRRPGSGFLFFSVWDSERAILCAWMISSVSTSSFVTCGNGRGEGFCPAPDSADRCLWWAISYTCCANRCPSYTPACHQLNQLSVSIAQHASPFWICSFSRFFIIIYIYCSLLASIQLCKWLPINSLKWFSMIGNQLL